MVAEPVTDCRSLDLAAVKGEAVIDGSVVQGEGIGADVMGPPPPHAVAWLANKLAETGGRLTAGDLVLTGSVVQTQWIDAASSIIRTSIEGWAP